MSTIGYLHELFKNLEMCQISVLFKLLYCRKKSLEIWKFTYNSKFNLVSWPNVHYTYVHRALERKKTKDEEKEILYEQHLERKLSSNWTKTLLINRTQDASSTNGTM